MKRVFAAVFVVLLVAAATALAAGTTGYRGTLDRGGGIQLTLKKKGKKERLTRFDFRRVPINCKGKRHKKTNGNLNVVVPIKQGAFAFHGGNGMGGTIHLRGRLIHNGRGIEGKLRLNGTIHLAGGTNGKDCKTGDRHYTAHRE